MGTFYKVWSFVPYINQNCCSNTSIDHVCISFLPEIHAVISNKFNIQAVIYPQCLTCHQKGQGRNCSIHVIFQLFYSLLVIDVKG